MSDHPRNPTLLVGLGAFGRDVLDLAARGPSGALGRGADKAQKGPRKARREGTNLARIEVMVTGGAGDAAPSPAERVLAEAKEKLRARLDLEHYVDHTEASQVAAD